ncbi:MarR family winged helix-turn-helix transcriptional regulator [Streptomyces sp. AK02-01A]|uniref:MarR family winged helix-turn-helix transcriptional regulator n=1 Tax=Streptomyces sp. AK02-01A TaxID=3028648 RepID=UPI0029BA8DA4|nr:MarR family winged helix-turn-helix transcriptional regulator [Streptomyces sp. AK02-01A]MDX3853458.1 MarR family winged helix-turn-helix transcriptional regulator [Streptomyces sp. AK02-01A]
MSTLIPSPPERGSHEKQTVRAFLGAARLLSEQLAQELRRATGMRQIHYEILGWLEEAPGHRMGMGDLARRSAVSPSRLSHLVDRLEERDWVRRLDSPRDGRAHLTELSAAGLTALREAAPWQARSAHARLLEHLSEEQIGQLRQISEILLGRLTGQAATDGADPAGQHREPGAGTH